jgi:hypothetical protein
MVDVDAEAAWRDRVAPDSHAPPKNYIYPQRAHPYYIIAPAYARTSAGIRALHLLCHSLNRRGQTARMIIYGDLPWREDLVSPDLMTPLITSRTRALDFERGLAPIMVYPEIISGNPYCSPCVVRYVLNFPGLLGGDTEYAPDELCFGFSAVLAARTRHPDNILFLPTVDTQVFGPPPVPQARQGTCFYAHKYRLLGGAPWDVTRDSTEITIHRPDSPNAQQIAALFHRSELFYAYENTALSIEAILCGCPAVLLPSPHFTENIGLKELGSAGYAWGADPQEIAHAKATVDQGARNFLEKYKTFWEDLDVFIERTQAHAAGKIYSHPILLPDGFDVIGDAVRRAEFAETRLGRLVTLQQAYQREIHTVLST